MFPEKLPPFSHGPRAFSLCEKLRVLFVGPALRCSACFAMLTPARKALLIFRRYWHTVLSYVPRKVAALQPRASGLFALRKASGTFRGPRSPVFRMLCNAHTCEKGIVNISTVLAYRPLLCSPKSCRPSATGLGPFAPRKASGTFRGSRSPVFRMLCNAHTCEKGILSVGVNAQGLARSAPSNHR